MTYNSRRNIIGMAAGILSVAAYIFYVTMGNAPAPEDIRAWARLMLVFIGIGVAAQIVIQVIFHVVFAAGIAIKEHDQDGKKTEKIIKASVIEDERDKLISLKSLRAGYICAGAGSMIALFVLAGGVSVVIALHMIVGSFAAGSLAEGFAGIILNERGVRNG